VVWPLSSPKQLELLWLGLRDHDEDETALSGSRGEAVLMLLNRLRVMKSRNSLGGWDGILRRAIRGERWYETKRGKLDLSICETIVDLLFCLFIKAATLPAFVVLRRDSSGLDRL
jgi:hypothetical protein